MPSHGVREVPEQVAPHLRPWIPVISLSTVGPPPSLAEVLALAPITGG